jgi:hypothetical protein
VSLNRIHAQISSRRINTCLMLTKSEDLDELAFTSLILLMNGVNLKIKLVACLTNKKM